MAHEVLDGETVVLDIERGVYYRLDPVGTRIFQRLVEGSPVEAIEEQLLREFDADPPTLRRDVADLLDDLASRGLLERAE